MRREDSRSEQGAATELGFIFTFLLGVLLLSMFATWAYGLETATRERWNLVAIEENMADVAVAVERADEASRLSPNLTYAEQVTWRPLEADARQMRLTLEEDRLVLETAESILDRVAPISSNGRGNHSGSIELSGVRTIWVVHDNGLTTISTAAPY